MPENDFLPIAIGGVPNVVAQASYAALAEQLQGYAYGEVVDSAVLNKMLRQPSVIAAMVSQAICDITGNAMLDDGNSATQLANFKLLLQLSGTQNYVGADTGSANAYAIAPSTPAVGYKGGQRFVFIPANANTGASTVNVSGLGVISIVRPDGTALRSGDIPAGGLVEIIYQATLNKFILTTMVAANGSGWFRIPGTKYIFQWASYSLTPSNTTNTPSGTNWGNVTVTFPISSPPDGVLYVSGGIANVTNNGQFSSISENGGAGSQTFYITSWGSGVTYPLVGVVWQIVS